MKIWIAVACDRYEGGRQFLAAAESADGAKAKAEAYHLSRNTGHVLSRWRIEPLRVPDFGGRSLLLGPKGWPDEVWTAGYDDNDGWYDVLQLDVG